MEKKIDKVPQIVWTETTQISSKCCSSRLQAAALLYGNEEHIM